MNLYKQPKLLKTSSRKFTAGRARKMSREDCKESIMSKARKLDIHHLQPNLRESAGVLDGCSSGG